MDELTALQARIARLEADKAALSDAAAAQAHLRASAEELAQQRLEFVQLLHGEVQALERSVAALNAAHADCERRTNLLRDFAADVAMAANDPTVWRQFRERIGKRAWDLCLSLEESHTRPEGPQQGGQSSEANERGPQ